MVSQVWLVSSCRPQLCDTQALRVKRLRPTDRALGGPRAGGRSHHFPVLGVRSLFSGSDQSGPHMGRALVVGGQKFRLRLYSVPARCAGSGVCCFCFLSVLPPFSSSEWFGHALTAEGRKFRLRLLRPRGRPYTRGSTIGGSDGITFWGPFRWASMGAPGAPCEGPRPGAPCEGPRPCAPCVRPRSMSPVQGSQWWGSQLVAPS